jgi:hypothetical protein
MNKLTDAVIVKTLEVCANEETDLCVGCPCFVNHCCIGYHNRENFITMVLDLINRQKAEIERLQKAIKVQDIMIGNQDLKIKGAKNEAIKELREKCVEHQDFHKGDDGKFRGWISVEDLDEIISEVSG